MNFAKKIINTLAVFGLIVFFTCPNYADDELSEAESYVNEVFSSLAKEVKKELNLSLFGSEASMPEKVNSMEMSFWAYQRSTIEEARLLTVYLTERLTKAINAHEKLRPYLRGYPFPAERVGIFLHFHNVFWITQGDGTVSRASHINTMGTSRYRNQIVYEVANPDPMFLQEEDLLVEPYEEAVRIVKNSSQSYPQPHQDTEKEQALDEVFGDFAVKMYYEKCFDLDAIGGDTVESINKISARFKVVARANRDQGRELIVDAAESLLNIIYAYAKKA